MPPYMGYQGNSIQTSVTIPSGQTDSNAIALNGFSLCGITLPSAFTGTALSFLVSNALDGTYVDLNSTISGTALTYTVAQSTYAAIDPKDFYGVYFLKVVSGSTEGGARVLTLSLKGI